MKRRTLAVVVAATGLTMMTGAAIHGTASAGPRAGIIGDDTSGEGTVPDDTTAYPPSSDEETTTTTEVDSGGPTTVVQTTVPVTTTPTGSTTPTTAPATTDPATTVTVPDTEVDDTEVASQAPTTVQVSSGGATAAVATTVSPGALPVTGSDSISGLQIGVVSVLTGAGLVAVGATRRKRRSNLA